MSIWTHIDATIVCTNAHVFKGSAVMVELTKPDLSKSQRWDYFYGKDINMINNMEIPVPKLSGHFPKYWSTYTKNKWGDVEYLPFGSEGGINVAKYKMDDEDREIFDVSSYSHMESAWIIRFRGNLRDFNLGCDLLTWFNGILRKCHVLYASLEACDDMESVKFENYSCFMDDLTKEISEGVFDIDRDAINKYLEKYPFPKSGYQ